MPLDDNYSFEAGVKAQNKAHLKRNEKNNNCALIETLVMDFLCENSNSTQVNIAKAIGKSRRAVQEAIAALKKKGLLEREGARKNGRWVVTK